MTLGLAFVPIQFFGCAHDDGSEKLAVAVEANRTEFLEFYDSKIFDEKLSSALNSEPQRVIVTPTSPVPLNGIPERMDKWLFVVQSSDGEVVTRENTGEGKVWLGVVA